MKSIFRLDCLTVFLVALLFIVPAANAASISRGAAALQAQPADTGTPAEETEAKPEKPKATVQKSPVKGGKKTSAPILKPIEAFKPQKTLVGNPKVNPGSGGLVEEIPVPNDMEVGITIPGSEGAALSIGGADDDYEQEADTIADSVIGNPKPKTARGLSPGNEVGRKPDTDPAGPVSSPGADAGLDPRDDPAGPVSLPGADVGLDPRDDPMGPVSAEQQ